MQIKWYGHASFLVTADDGTTIVTDPYGPEAGYVIPIPDAPDIVIMSSDNDLFHCRADLVPGEPIVINALTVAQNGGTRTEKGIEFHAIEAMEALDHHQHDPDQNGMYRFEVDGIQVGHLGDVGNPFSQAQMDFFKGVDVLLTLTGGHPTIKLPDLMDVIHETKPKLIVPMHFRTLRYRPREQFWIQTFIDFFGDEERVDFVCDSEVTLTKADIPDETRVMVLTHV